ncbi:hypothetical protein B7P43_G08856 [Cryptotermes secundus]|uniref:Uncharacterized protein n=1 Tax=Cryptotermes secundus TaxID=105785 RepID=A0A2J7RJE5_9NEOP|nr:hypothetical protein B7P43_G08856 [Cryptotermes secundus]
MHRMQAGYQEPDLQLSWLADSSNNAGDVGSAENCSLSSPRQAHDDQFSSVCRSGDAVYTSVTCNTSASDRTTGSIFSGTGSSLEPGKGDMSRLVDAIANLDICEDKIDSGKYDLSGSKEEHEHHEQGSPWPHHNEDIKAQCSRKDLVSKPTDSGPEEKEVYPEMKHDSAYRSQLHTVPVGNSSCSPDLHISVGSNSVINCSVSQSSYVHARGISEPTLCKTCGIDAVGLLTCNCARDATAAISGGSRNEAEAVHRIATEEGKMNYVTLPNEILVGALVTKKPETIKMVVDSGKANTELCSIESVSVTQTYTPEISFIRENEVNVTSSLDSCVSYSQTVSRPLSDLSEDASASASEPNLPSLSIGTHALAPNVQTFGVLEPFLNQNLVLSCPTTGAFSHNTSTQKIVPSSLSFLASEPAWVHPQLTSSCSKIQNSGAVPKYVTCSTNMNNTFQDFAGNRKYSFGVPLRSKQTVAAGISNVFSWPLASESSFFQDMPPKCSASSDPCIWKNTNKSSVTVLDSSSRESSVFTGFKFCTLGSPISSSSISKLSDGSFQHGRTTSFLDSGEIFKCGAPCTESVMAAAGTVGNTYFRHDFTAEVNTCSNTVSTSGQNTGCSISAESSGVSASAFVSFGKLSPPALTKISLSVPNTSAVSVGQFGKPTSLSLTGSGTEFERSTPYKSKLGFESYSWSPKFEPLKETSLTKTAFADVFPGDRTGDLKSPRKASGSSAPTSRSSLFPPGSTEMKQSDGMKAFDYVSNFKNIPSCSPNNFNTNLISNGFNFGIPSAAPSHSALFSFTGSIEKLGRSSELNLQKRSRRPRRLRKFVLSVCI